jgi:thymidylate synthase (FAD)
MDNYIPALDHGFVGLVDSMGDDAAIVQAARVSYGAGTKTKREDEGLIRYLVRNRHSSPLEMVEFKFHVACPISIARQWLRHRTASVNEYSLRYSEAIGAVYQPPLDRMTGQDTKNKQGSTQVRLADEEGTHWLMGDEMAFATRTYQQLLERGLNRETARGILPLNQYTEFYWKIDLHNLLHFLGLRMDSHAQPEIQEYARRILSLIHPVAPAAVDAWIDNVFLAKTFSREAFVTMGVDEFHAAQEELHNTTVEVGDYPRISAAEARVRLHGDSND